MHIAFTPGNNYVMPTGVAMCSILENTPAAERSDLVFHIVTFTDFDENGFNALRNISDRYGANIQHHTLSRETIEPYFPSHAIDFRGIWSYNTYVRLFLADILSDIDKVLYLDGDIIVRRSLNEFWKTPITDVPLAAALFVSWWDPEFKNRARLPSNAKYFNAGVLLLNLDYWRKQGVLNILSQDARKIRDCMKYNDQDILNYSFGSSVKIVDPTFNLTAGTRMKGVPIFWEDKQLFDNALEDPCIVHFTGSKPWHRNCADPWRKIFFHYLQLTEWAHISMSLNECSRRMKFLFRTFPSIAERIMARKERDWKKCGLTLFDR